MSHTIVGYYSDVNTLLNQVYWGLVGPYGAEGVDVLSHSSPGGYTHTQFALIALPERGITDGKYRVYFAFKKVAEMDNGVVTLQNWKANPPSGGGTWDQWIKYRNGSSYTSSCSGFFVNSEYLASEILGAINHDYNIMRENGKPAFRDDSQNFINIYEGDWAGTSAGDADVLNFIQTIFGTPAPTPSVPHGVGTAVLTLSAPGEYLTFSSRDKQTSQTVYVDDNVDISFD